MNIQEIGAIGIGFVVIAIILAFGATILGSLGDSVIAKAASGCNTTDVTACGMDYNATQYGLQSIDTMTDWLPTLALIVVAAIIIGIVVRYLSGRSGSV